MGSKYLEWTYCQSELNQEALNEFLRRQDGHLVNKNGLKELGLDSMILKRVSFTLGVD